MGVVERDRVALVSAEEEEEEEFHADPSALKSILSNTRAPLASSSSSTVGTVGETHATLPFFERQSLACFNSSSLRSLESQLYPQQQQQQGGRMSLLGLPRRVSRAPVSTNGHTAPTPVPSTPAATFRPSMSRANGGPAALDPGRLSFYQNSASTVRGPAPRPTPRPDHAEQSAPSLNTSTFLASPRHLPADWGRCTPQPIQQSRHVMQHQQTEQRKLLSSEMGLAKHFADLCRTPSHQMSSVLEKMGLTPLNSGTMTNTTHHHGRESTVPQSVRTGTTMASVSASLDSRPPTFVKRQLDFSQSVRPKPDVQATSDSRLSAPFSFSSDGPFVALSCSPPNPCQTSVAERCLHPILSPATPLRRSFDSALTEVTLDGHLSFSATPRPMDLRPFNPLVHVLQAKPIEADARGYIESSEMVRSFLTGQAQCKATLGFELLSPSKPISSGSPQSEQRGTSSVGIAPIPTHTLSTSAGLTLTQHACSAFSRPASRLGAPSV